MVCVCGHSDCVHHLGEECSLCLRDTKGEDGCYNYREKPFEPFVEQFYFVCSCGETYSSPGSAEYSGECRRCRNPDLRTETVNGTIKPWIFKQFKSQEEYMKHDKWPEAFV